MATNGSQMEINSRLGIFRVHIHFCGLYNVVLETKSMSNSPRRYCDSPMSNHSIEIKTNTFKVSYITVT